MTFNILHFCGSIQKDHSIEELSMLKDIMAQTVNMFSPIEIMLGYTLYSNTKVCFITEVYGITMNFLPKTNTTFRAKGIQLGKMIMYDFVDNPPRMLQE